MSPLLKGLIGTQLLAAVFGVSYFAVLTYRNYPDAMHTGLRIWAYFAVIFLFLHLFLALKQWWENSRRRR